jgi:hypothetical protein
VVSEPKLNWATAEVEDARLTVAIGGEIPSGWKRSFNSTLRLLGRGDWGKVKVQSKKGAIRVCDVSFGSEERLRHHLESVVEQANASLRASEPDSAGPQDEDAPDGPDARMTERFRAFADADEEPAPR